MSSSTNAIVRDTQMEVSIAADAATVWQTLTEQIGDWWPDEFFAGGEPAKRRYVLEARLGGRMYEEWDGGGGILWGTVASLEPARRLQVMGSTFADWGGPSLWFGTWELEANGATTLLRFSESTLGRLSDRNAEQTSKAWKFLFGEVLKAHIEGTPVPQYES